MPTVAFVSPTAVPLHRNTKDAITGHVSVLNRAKSSPRMADSFSSNNRMSIANFVSILAKSARISVTAVAFAIIAGSPTLPCHARTRQSKHEAPVITMTDQVPNFSLPSQKERSGRFNTGSVAGIARTVVSVAVKKVVPAAGIIALAVWAVSKVLRRAQEKQLRDFQSQLQSFSSMLDLDASKLDLGSANSPKNKTDRISTSPDTASRGSQRYKFRTDEQETESEQIAEKVRLDLFQGSKPETSLDPSASNLERKAASTESSANTTSQVPPGQGDMQDDSSIKPIVPETPYERAIGLALDAVQEVGMTPSDVAAGLEESRDEASMSVEDAKIAFSKYMSRVVSAQVDRAVIVLSHEPTEAAPTGTPEQAMEGMKLLNHLASTMKVAGELAQACGFVTGLAYVGSLANTERIREELYRSYAVFCLSDEARVKDKSAVQGLLDMQMLLSLSDSRAEAVNREIAKGMFQVAVSSAMADGSLNDESKDALQLLKKAFSELLDSDSADNIISEVSVMRAMYSLQQLLQEQGVNEEDVAELRKMCADLGVDVDEVMRNADAMGDALGPEAKQFVGGLRALLQDDKGEMADNIGNLMANAALEVASSESENSEQSGTQGTSQGNTWDNNSQPS